MIYRTLTIAATAALILTGCIPPTAVVAQEAATEADQLLLKTLVELRNKRSDRTLRMDTSAVARGPVLGPTARGPSVGLGLLARQSGLPAVVLDEAVLCPYPDAPILRECGFRNPDIRIVRIGGVQVDEHLASVFFTTYGGSADDIYRVWSVAEFRRCESGWCFVRFVTIGTS